MTEPRHELADGSNLGPCAQPENLIIWDTLADLNSGPYYRWAVAEANTICRTSCTKRDTCWTDEANKEWVQILIDGAPEDTVPTRDCVGCGVTFEIGPRQGLKRFCSDACNKAVWRAKREAA